MMNQQIPVDLISDFLVLSEQLNISKTAKQLKISQPALTRRLKALEDALGAQLFVRQSRGLSLTALGRTLKIEVTPALERLESAFAKVQELQHELKGSLTIGCFSEFASHVIAPALIQFAQQHPSVKFEIRSLSEQEIISGVADGSLHLGVSSRVPKNEGIRAYKLMVEQVCVVTSPDNPDLEKCAEPAFVGYRSTDRLLNQYLKSQTKLSNANRPEVVFAVNSHAAMIEAVAALNLYAALPMHSVAAALQEKTVRLASKKFMRNEMHILVSESDFTDKKTQLVLSFLRKRFKQIN
ncbi:MAG: HTH-type transcriptional regulator CynR [Pseudomonadota bacterium]|jgi:LysR family transcriptional regulator of abg operon